MPQGLTTYMRDFVYPDYLFSASNDLGGTLVMPTTTRGRETSTLKFDVGSREEKWSRTLTRKSSWRGCDIKVLFPYTRSSRWETRRYERLLT
jgi:hypothetical protein